MTISGIRRALTCAALFIVSIMMTGTASAYDWLDGFSVKKKEGDQYALLVSPYTRHYNEDPEHSHVWLVGIERQRTDGSLAGIAYFSNSFGQPSGYYFPWGMAYREFLGLPQLTAKVTAGVLYGYTGIYKDKVPFNYGGFSPAIVPALAWELGDGFQLQANMLGLNGMMFQLTLPLQ